MTEEYGGNFITLTDEDGQDIELEHLDTLEFNGSVYMAFFPAEEAGDNGEPPEEDEESGLVILKVIMVDGEEQLSTLDNDDELGAVYDQFMESLFSEEEDSE